MELKEAIEDLKGYVEEKKRYKNFAFYQYLAKDMHIESIETILQGMEQLQQENDDFRKLEKDHNYSSSVIRENTRLRYDLSHSISDEKIEAKREEKEKKLNKIDFTKNVHKDAQKHEAWTILLAKIEVLDELLGKNVLINIEEEAMEKCL